MQVDSKHFTSMRYTLQYILRNEGVIGLYRGNWLNVIRIFPQGGSAFLIKDYVKNQFVAYNIHHRQHQIEATSTQLLIASTTSGALSMVLVYPLDMIRGQITVLPPNSFNSIYHALQVNVRESNGNTIQALYKGVSYSVIWSTIYYGSQFYVYDTLKSFYLKYYINDSNNIGVSASTSSNRISGIPSFVIGSIAGTVCTTLAFPFESVRRKLQLQGLANRPILYTGMRHCFRTVIREEGIKNGLFRGLLPNLYKSPLAVALIFSIHETLMSFAKRQGLY
jgi:solute carrier family 25 phosphate transporter 23/24/25/41